MSKLGVGIGEDFPVDDGKPGAGGESPRDDREEFEDWKRRRDEWRAQKEEWRRRREEWRARKRAFKEKVRDAARENFGPEWEKYRHESRRWHAGPHRFWPLWMLAPLIGVLAVVALIAAAISSPFVFLALAALGIFFFSHRRHHHHPYYDFDMQPANGPIVTPAPKSHDAPPASPPAAPPGGK